MSWRETKHAISNVSDHADVVLKKSDEKILSGDKISEFYKSAFYSVRIVKNLPGKVVEVHSAIHNLLFSMFFSPLRMKSLLPCCAETVQ